MLKHLSFLTLILTLSSCRVLYDPMPKTWQWGIKPRPWNGMKGFPSTDSEYGKGFRDGCTTSWDAVSKGLMGDLQSRYDFKRMQKSSDYQTGWWDGYEQCTYILDWDVV